MKKELIIPNGLKEYLEKKSMMEILGVDRDENAHSKFLGWLFDYEDTRVTAINSIIRLWKEKADEKLPSIEYEEYKKAINDSTQFPEVEEKSFIEVKLEDFVVSEDSNCYGRADIVINIADSSGKRHIIIENKIDSLEHKMGIEKAKSDWQTIEYYKYYTKKYNGEYCLFLFLTRPEYQITISKKQKEKEQIQEESQCPVFIWIDYQDILSIITCFLYNEKIEDYKRCLGYSRKNEDVMAIDTKTAEQCVLLWDNNKNLFVSSFKKNRRNDLWNENKDIIRPILCVLHHIIKRKIKLDNKYNGIIEEGKADIEKIYSLISDKDNTCYSILHKGKPIKVKVPNRRETTILTKNALVGAVVWLYVKNYESDINDLRETFQPSLRMFGKQGLGNWNAKSNKVIDVINEQGVYNDWKKLGVFRVNNDESLKESNIQVNQTGWDGREMMDNFIKHVLSKLREEYSIEEVFPEEGEEIANKKMK